MCSQISRPSQGRGGDRPQRPGDNIRLENLAGALRGEAVFILGNSPRLPVDDLHVLDGHFTIGVNRIGQVFDPTILLIADASAYKDAIFGEAQLLLSPEMNVKRKGGAWYPKLFVASLKWPKHPGELHAHGNSGVAAGSWANALGCEPIYLVGMEAKYKGDKSDFYGLNKHHRDGTVYVLNFERERILNAFPHCIPVADGEHLKKVAAKHKSQSRKYWMDKLNANLSL